MNMANLRKSTVATLVTSSLLVGSMYSMTAHAELSIGALAGVATHTTRVRGDAIHAYGAPGFYFAYPTDINTNPWAAGLFARYTYLFPQKFFLGLESGYVFLGANQDRKRADDVQFPGIASWVERFGTKSEGVVLLNFIAGYQIVPCVKFSIFAGPAWLNTKYTANAFVDGVTISTHGSYQITADLGAEVDYDFMKNWSAGMRYDYIFETKSRTVSSVGTFGDLLIHPLRAKSYLNMFTFNVRYLIPCT